MRDLTTSGRGTVVAAAVAVFENKETTPESENPRPSEETPKNRQQFANAHENPSRIDQNIEKTIQLKAQSPKPQNKRTSPKEEFKSRVVEKREMKSNVKIESVRRSVVTVVKSGVVQDSGGIRFKKAECLKAPESGSKISSEKITRSEITSKTTTIEDTFKTKAATSKTIPTKEDASKTIAANAASSKTIPAKEDASKTIATNAATSKTIATKEDASKTIVTNAATSKTIATKEDASKTIAANAASSKTITTKEDPSKTIATNAATSKTIATKEDASKTIAANAATSKTTTTKEDLFKTIATNAATSKTIATKEDASKTIATKAATSKTITPLDINKNQSPAMKLAESKNEDKFPSKTPDRTKPQFLEENENNCHSRKLLDMKQRDLEKYKIKDYFPLKTLDGVKQQELNESKDKFNSRNLLDSEEYKNKKYFPLKTLNEVKQQELNENKNKFSKTLLEMKQQELNENKNDAHSKTLLEVKQQGLNENVNNFHSKTLLEMKQEELNENKNDAHSKTLLGVKQQGLNENINNFHSKTLLEVKRQEMEGSKNEDCCSSKTLDGMKKRELEGGRSKDEKLKKSEISESKFEFTENPNKINKFEKSKIKLPAETLLEVASKLEKISARDNSSLRVLNGEGGEGLMKSDVILPIIGSEEISSPEKLESKGNGIFMPTKLKSTASSGNCDEIQSKFASPVKSDEIVKPIKLNEGIVKLERERDGILCTEKLEVGKSFVEEPLFKTNGESQNIEENKSVEPSCFKSNLKSEGDRKELLSKSDGSLKQTKTGNFAQIETSFLGVDYKSGAAFPGDENKVKGCFSKDGNTIERDENAIKRDENIRKSLNANSRNSSSCVEENKAKGCISADKIESCVSRDGNKVKNLISRDENVMNSFSSNRKNLSGCVDENEAKSCITTDGNKIESSTLMNENTIRSLISNCDENNVSTSKEENKFNSCISMDGNKLKRSIFRNGNKKILLADGNNGGIFFHRDENKTSTGDENENIIPFADEDEGSAETSSGFKNGCGVSRNMELIESASSKRRFYLSKKQENANSDGAMIKKQYPFFEGEGIAGGKIQFEMFEGEGIAGGKKQFQVFEGERRNASLNVDSKIMENVKFPDSRELIQKGKGIMENVKVPNSRELIQKDQRITENIKIPDSRELIQKDKGVVENVKFSDSGELIRKDKIKFECSSVKNFPTQINPDESAGRLNEISFTNDCVEKYNLSMFNAQNLSEKTTNPSDCKKTKDPFIPSQVFSPSRPPFASSFSPFGRAQEMTTTEVATILLNKVKKNAAVNGKLEENSGDDATAAENSSSCPGVSDYPQYHRGVEVECCAFESAVKDFDMTAEDVQKFVAESMRSIANDRKKADLRRDSDCKSESAPSEDTSETSDDDDLISETTDYSEDCMVREGLATIAEEVTASSVHSSDDDQDGSSEASTSPDEDGTVKTGQEKWCNGSIRTGSSSDMSSTSSERTNPIKDSSTRCNGDFQWICKDPIPKEKKPEDCVPLTKPPINRNRDRTPRRSVEKTPPGSLDRRRHHHNNQQNRQERDQKSRSSHVLKSPPRLEDFIGSNGPCKNWCCSPHPHQQDYYFDFHRRHERMDPQRYGSNPMLMDRFCERGSHPDLYRHEGMGCSCAYHMPPPPPCYYYGGDGRSYHWTPSKPPDQDERTRKLQAERDNLQLQVQVLTEQIEAQGDKIGDLEKNLNEKKQQLISSEDLLQREMLSRSSLETQKLELMTTISELKLQQAALERENLELKSTVQMNNNSIDGIKKPPFLPRASPQPAMTSTPVHGSNQALRKSPSPSPVTVNSSGTSPRRADSTTQEVQSPKTPPTNYRRQIELQYASLPRQQFLSNGGSALSVVDSNANPANGVRKGVAFADTEKIVIDEPNGDAPQSPSVAANKNKGIKKIFGKIKRSGSGNLEDFGMGCGEFQRGGIRATASARLGWSEPIPTIKPDKPFAEWDTENICDWLQDLGLDQYVPDAKKWVKSGQQLVEASMAEIEKELVIKNPLHRKKLQLALIDAEENSSSDPFLEKAGKLDTAWVLRWLDDTGLPQYKETFLLNRIDGRVLHRLTMDDLALLHVTSLLHVASIKRGIQVLRENNYEAGCLQRRSLPEDPDAPTPKQVSLWTTHRVMEWLRAVDLAEYAPNLRGAGVHGGLLVHENKFTAELLAALLSIPPGKTLLRRHLNTHFNALLGKDIIQAKREAESTLGYIPLTPASKVKIAKKSHFSLKRNKSKSEADYGDLVCPLNQNSGENCQNGSTINNSMGMMRTSAKEEAAYHLAEEEYFSSSSTSSPLLARHN